MIFNLTQESSTPEQQLDGVAVRGPELRAKVRDLLTFQELPDSKQVEIRAEELCEFVAAAGYDSAMLSHWPSYLTVAVDRALRRRGIRPLYSFQQRSKISFMDGQGHVVEQDNFVHTGWVRLDY